MGWLTATRNGETLYYGDQSLDACTEFLKKLAEEYRETDLERLPTIDEILLNLEIVLGADPGLYAEDGKDTDLLGLSAKTKRASSRPKVEVGDVVSIPFTRNLYGFGQVLETEARDFGVLGLYPIVESGPANIAALVDLEFISHFRIELTCIPWKHWRVIGNLPLPGNLKIKRADYDLPCFVAELEFIEALQKADVLDTSFRLYEDVQADSPKLRPQQVERMTHIMTFLRDKNLLSDAGKEEIAGGRVPADFSMHSGLLTEEGRRFYEEVFKKDYQSDYFWTDIHKKLEMLWDQFRS